MTDPNTAEQQTDPQGQQPGNDPQQQASQQQQSGEDAKGLRKQLEDVLAENKQLKASQRQTAFRDAGFDPESGEGKALAKLYDGEADADAIRKFAADEFGWQPATAAQQPTDADVQRAAAQQRVDQVNAASTSGTPTDLPTQIAEAEQAGDWQKAGVLKNRLLTEQFSQIR